MSYSDGMAALHLEMPKRIPRTEYSASSHWALVSAVTGIQVDHTSDETIRRAASTAFEKAWRFDLNWSIGVGEEALSPYRTYMGHAIYAEGGTDFNDQIVSPFEDEEAVLRFDPFEKLTRHGHEALVQHFNACYAREQSGHPSGVCMTGCYITGISGLLGLFGWDKLLMAAGVDSAGFGHVANRYALWVQQYFDALADCDSPVIMVHDDIVWTSGPFITPQWYRQYVFPHYKTLFAPLLDAKKTILYTSDGCYDAFVHDIAACGVHGFVMEPITDMKAIAEKYGQSHAIVGNADTRILLYGSRDDIEAEVRRCIDIGRDCPGFFMAVGNHIPSNTPVENALWYNECYEKYAMR